MRLKKLLAPILCLIGVPALAKPFINLPSAGLGSPAAQADSPAPSPTSPASPAAEVVGYWSKSQTFGADLAVTFQFHFGSNGAFETRAHSRFQGEESRMHGHGTWTLKGESVELAMDPKRCLIDEGAGTVPCEEEDTGAWTVAVRETLGVRSLVDTADGDEMAIADYVGPQKQFTLPELSRPSALGPSARDALSGLRRGLSIPGRAGSPGIGFDMTGRASGPGGAATPRVPLNYYKLR